MFLFFLGGGEAFCLMLFDGLVVLRKRGKGWFGGNMMTHLHMHGFPSGLLERVETSLTSLSTCLISLEFSTAMISR